MQLMFHVLQKVFPGFIKGKSVPQLTELINSRMENIKKHAYEEGDLEDGGVEMSSGDGSKFDSN